MNKQTLKTVIWLVSAILFTITSFSCVSDKADKQESSSIQISDKPMTFCNPITLNWGADRARRAGEPVVVIHQDDYYLFITGLQGYWYSANFKNWTYVDAPDLPGGCPSVVSDGERLIVSGDKTRRDVFASEDPKSGVWKKVGYYDREYGDADMFIDDDGRYYMYWGWSQILPFQVVELDPDNGFKEKGKPVTLFFGDYKAHGFERRRPEDVIFSIFSYRNYLPEENPWIEGPWMVKHNGKYYLQYAAIGLELSTYSHGVYVADNPMGPFEYSPHNPLTFKTTGFVVGPGHGSTFHDKNGQLWTIAMVPSMYGGGRGSADIALFPTAVDAEGFMHSNTEFGDFPQYYPGLKENAVDNNFTGWMLLSRKKYVEASSTLKGFGPENAVDENFLTHWCAASGDPGEYMTVDLGKECDIYALQINFDRHDVKIEMGRGFRMPPSLSRYQSFTVEVSADNENWSTIIDKSNNTVDDRHDYTELANPVKARFVKLTNVFTHDDGKFAVKDFRIFGNPDAAKFTKVNDVMVVRDPENPCEATLLWQPVAGADGYVVRYGIEPGKLYNDYMVYDAYTLNIHSLNRDEKYYFEVEAFDSGTDNFHEKTRQTMGIGAEIELFRGREMLGRKMIVEGINEYIFENIVPGEYQLRHTFGPNMWAGELIKDQVIGAGDQATLSETLSDLGVGTEVLGQLEIKVLPGKDSGKFVVSLNYNKP
ncbi:family 43 glycosylhydrolase [candidate division KSB1 bacterium]|nr:family 43 glycosylhydrolase [candidate division KSB1 bacterium]